MRLLLFFTWLALISCTKTGHWVNDRICSDQKNHCSTKLSYFSHDPTHGIDVEWVQTQEEVKVYLNVHSVPVPPWLNDPKNVLVDLTIGSRKEHAIAYRFEGGQRFLLSQETVKTLVDALEEGQPITLALPGYHSVIKPEDFSTKFKEFNHPLPYTIPFKNPLNK